MKRLIIIISGIIKLLIDIIISVLNLSMKFLFAGGIVYLWVVYSKYDTKILFNMAWFVWGISCLIIGLYNVLRKTLKAYK